MMDIGIIGAGKIGGTLGNHLARAGHRIRFGVRNPDVSDVAHHSNISIGLPEDAVAFAEILIFAGPFGAWPDFALAFADALSGKPVIDAANLYLERDGASAVEIGESGIRSTSFVAGLLSRSSVVKAFNSIYWIDLRDRAGRAGERLGMPIAGDDPNALAIAARLAGDAGFDPIVIGGLADSRDIEPGGAVYAQSMTAAQIQITLGLSA